MIYFDNAATGGFKPNSVSLAFNNALNYLCANPGRSGHRLSVLGEEAVFKTRQILSKTFNNRAIERVVFTKNCTEALNLAIFGSVCEGDEIITTVTEHNSVLRPLYHLKRTKNVSLKIIEPEKGNVICREDILKAVTKNTKLVVMNAVSNVTGAKNEFENLGDIPLVLDGAQMAGHCEIDMTASNISALCLACHKGLYAPMGMGALIFRKDFDISPTFFGGTGTESFAETPSVYPEMLECGTLSLPQIVATYDGVEFAVDYMQQSQKRLTFFTEYLVKELKKMGADVFSNGNPYGIVSFSLSIPSQKVSEILSENFNIATRAGFHCAPLMHKFLKTDCDGLVRVSLSAFNTEREIDKFLLALNKIIRDF